MHNLALNRVNVRSFQLLPLRNVPVMLKISLLSSLLLKSVEILAEEANTRKLEKRQKTLAPVY